MRHFKVYISLLLLSLFAAYQVSITMFTHVHYINGMRVVHSHPYNIDHTHSQAEVIVIQHLSDYHTLEANIPFFVCAEDVVYDILEVKPEQSRAYDSCNRVTSLRAPPAFPLA